MKLRKSLGCKRHILTLDDDPFDDTLGIEASYVCYTVNAGCLQRRFKLVVNAMRIEFRQCFAELDMLQPADVIVTEIFDSVLLGEGILATMRHALKNLLKVKVRCP